MKIEEFIKTKNLIEFILLLEDTFISSKKKITKINVSFKNELIEKIVNASVDFRFVHPGYIKCFFESGTDKKEIITGKDLLKENLSKENFLYKFNIVSQINFDNRYDVYSKILLETSLSKDQKRDFLANIDAQSKTILKNRKRKQYHSCKKLILPDMQKIIIDGREAEYRAYINNLKEIKEWGDVHNLLIERKFENEIYRIKNMLSECIILLVNSELKDFRFKYKGDNWFRNIEITSIDISKLPIPFSISGNNDDAIYEKLKELFIRDACLLGCLVTNYGINEKLFNNKNLLKAYMQDFMHNGIRTIENEILLEEVADFLVKRYKSEKEKFAISGIINKDYEEKNRKRM